MLCEHQFFRTFKILAPRYRDKKVLLMSSKVMDHNKIIFTNSPSMGDTVYYLSKKTIKKYKKEIINDYSLYAVPLKELKELKLDKFCPHIYW